MFVLILKEIHLYIWEYLEIYVIFRKISKSWTDEYTWAKTEQQNLFLEEAFS